MGEDNLRFYADCDCCKIGYIYSVVADEVYIAAVASTASLAVIGVDLLVDFKKRKQ